jgi:virulence-associated protein VagC
LLYANAHNSNSILPHVNSQVEFPHHRWATVRQTIEVHVPQNSQALTQLSIDIPENFEFQTSKIEITDGDRVINAPISRQGQRLEISFSQPITPDRQLRIDLNGVSRNTLTKSSTYYVYGKTIDGTNSFLGEAYFPQAD